MEQTYAIDYMAGVQKINKWNGRCGGWLCLHLSLKIKRASLHFLQEGGGGVEQSTRKYFI